MKAFKIFWKLLLGGALTAAGWYMVSSQLEETALTGGAVIGVALIAVGVANLADAFN